MTRAAFALLAVLTMLAGCSSTSATTQTVAVTLSGGFDLQPGDFGRPIPLYASMLGVPTEVFREAFSGVNPNREHEPTPEEEQANKAALLRVLGPYGVTDQKMNEVADYYRFNSAQGESWPHHEASAHAELAGGSVVRIVVDDAGVGYAYPPTVAVAGHPEVTAAATLAFTTDVATNGHIASIDIS